MAILWPPVQGLKIINYICLNPKMYLSTSQVVFVQMLKCICLVLPGLWVIWEGPGGGDPSGDQTEFTTCAHDNPATLHLLFFPSKDVSRIFFNRVFSFFFLTKEFSFFDIRSLQICLQQKIFFTK